jgi:type VI secretion system secreted protein VgrG
MKEIWPDKFGRVRVRFPWDREAKYACWLRVVQPWAGKQWVPRVGDEVAVTFLEGDPDVPVAAAAPST